MNSEADNQNSQGITIQAGMVRVSSVGWMVNMLAHQMDRAMSEALTPNEVTIDQFKVIMTLMEFDGVSQAIIGKKIGMPSYSVTRLLDSMENTGLIGRHPDAESRRSFNIRLTRKGKALAPKLFDAVNSVNKEVLAPLSASEKKQLAKLLGKVIPASVKETNEPR